MPSESFDHIDVKFFVCLVLKEIIASSGMPLHALSDGATVRIDSANANGPDALVYAGPKRPGRSVALSDPLIVVEVVSPTSGRRERIRKRLDYFSLPSVEHYLIVDPEDRTVTHFDRSNWQGEGRVAEAADTISLVPPGIDFPVRRCFELK